MGDEYLPRSRDDRSRYEGFIDLSRTLVYIYGALVKFSRTISFFTRTRVNFDGTIVLFTRTSTNFLWNILEDRQSFLGQKVNFDGTTDLLLGQVEKETRLSFATSLSIRKSHDRMRSYP